MNAETSTLTYEVTGRIARITLDRPERGNGITLDMPRELADCVERANLDPAVHVIALSGTGRASAAATTSSESAEGGGGVGTRPAAPPGSPLDPAVDGRESRPAAHLGPGRRLRR